MQRDIRRTFEAYGMEATNFEASMNVHGERDWSLRVSLRNESPPMEMRTAGSRHVRYIEGRRSSTVIVNGDATDLRRAGSEAILFRQIAEALHRLVSDRMISGETITVSCHELLHRYLDDGGRFDHFDHLHLHSNNSMSDASRNELRNYWGFSDHDVKTVEKRLEVEANGPTEASMEESYRV